MTRSLPFVALALAAVTIVVDAGVVLGGKTWDDRAYHTEIAPPRIAAATQVLAGTVPAWWDGTSLGVPLAGEPGHGAMYPATWIATGPRALDLVMLVHLVWLALGVAWWARRDASAASALVAGALALTAGVITSSALRGALPAIAHLPWLGGAASALALAADRRTRARWAATIAVLVGAIALAGLLGVLADAVVLAIVLAWPTRGARDANASDLPGGAARDARAAGITTLRAVGWLGAALAAGLAIGAVQWIPAIALRGMAGATVHGLELARLGELVAPVWSPTGWPMLHTGAVVVALALARRPGRVGIAMIVLALLALVIGRGGWPAVLGAPEVHLAALVAIAAPAAARGLDAFCDRERRATIAVAIAIALTVPALIAAAAVEAPATALAAGMAGIACLGGAIVARRIRPLALVLVVAPGAIAQLAIVPTIDRAIVDEPPAWARAAEAASAPRRVFRPARLDNLPDTLEDAMATLAASGRFALALAHSTDPARPAIEDRAWLAAAHGGGELLDRFAIALAILPASVAYAQHLDVLGTRGPWVLARFPATPVASVIGNWMWIDDDSAALARLFPPLGTRGIGRGRIVLAGRGEPSEEADTAPVPCTIDRWESGAIDLACTAAADAYAVVSSSAAAGWTVTVDDRAAAWVRADVLRRAVAIPAGTHRVRWRYRTPGLPLALVLAALGVAAAGALGWRARRS